VRRNSLGNVVFYKLAFVAAAALFVAGAAVRRWARRADESRARGGARA
jgi:hypothetical protein